MKSSTVSLFACFKIFAQMTCKWEGSPTFWENKNFVDKVWGKCSHFAIFLPHPPSIFNLLCMWFKEQRIPQESAWGNVSLLSVCIPIIVNNLIPLWRTPAWQIQRGDDSCMDHTLNYCCKTGWTDIYTFLPRLGLLSILIKQEGSTLFSGSVRLQFGEDY